MKQTIVGSILGMLRDLGVDLIQGHLLAKPAFAALATPVLPGQPIDTTVAA